VRYDAIFMDHMMPGMDGIEATRRIREEIGTEYARTVPIIALTANALVGNERMFLERGFQAFLAKPIDIPRLDQALRQWVRDRVREEGEGREEPEEEAAPAGAAEASGPRLPEGRRIDGLDLEQCRERFGGDEEIVFQALRSYAAHTPGLLDQVRAPAQGDLSGYALIMHGIKGSSYGICADRAGKLAEELESAALAGDFAFIREHNGAFLKAAEGLIAALSALLSAAEEGEEKARRDAPDAAALDRLREACARYDMDEVDAAMAELESYSYERRRELIVWLRDRVDRMDFQQILDALRD
jgi:DNA-binding NarL/FixJ family response regulator